MDSILKAVLALGAGAILLWANVRYVQAVWAQLRPSAAPQLIAPFEVLGGSGNAAARGAALARMLQVRLERIRDEIAVSDRALQRARESPRSGLQTEELAKVRVIALPDRILEAPQIALSVGGVEVGGLLSSLYRAWNTERALRVVVSYKADGKASVGGAVDALPDFGFWIDTTGPESSDIVRDVAYALTHRQMSRRVPEMAALDLGEFRELVESLTALAELNAQVESGRRPAPDRYESLYQKLAALSEKTPDWAALVRLAAQTAENASKPAEAAALYRREIELAGDGPDVEQLRTHVAELEQSLVAARATAGGEEALRRVLGVASLEMRGKPRIAVVGGLPSAAALDSGPHEIVGAQPQRSASASSTETTMTSYLDALVKTVRIVAPKATLVFRPQGPNVSASSVIDDLTAFADQHVDLVLFALQIPTGVPALPKAIRKLHDLGIPIVVTAGNSAGQPPGAVREGIANAVLIAAATDFAGTRQAPFTQWSEGCVWAPGEEIPIDLGRDASQGRAGTAFSAALAAGIAARVLDRHPGLTPDALRRVLVESSERVSPDGPPVLRLDRAQAALEKPSPGQG